MSQCKIHLENYSGLYYAGSEIRGRLECYFEGNTSLRGIKIRFKCKEYNKWTDTETYTDSDNNRKTRNITLTGENNVLHVEQMLYGSDHGTQHLGRGRHVYPFSYTLPYNIPSTFNGPYGAVCYKIKAIVDKPMRFDYEDSFIFVVQSRIDFNRMSRELQTITTYSDEKTVCCWCCAGGNISMDVELPKTAFTPGEVIPVKVALCNLSNSSVDCLKGTLTKTITYRVTHPHPKSKSDIEQILSFREHGVGAHGEHIYEIPLQIPSNLDVPNFKNCNLFNVTYNLQVCSEMPACTLDLDISIWDIKFGHVQCPQSYLEEGGEEGTVNHNQFPPGDYGPPPPAGDFVPPLGFAGGYAPPPAYPGEKGAFPGGPPSAPSSSNPFAPLAPHEDNPKAREAAGEPSAPADPGLPPPSYTQAQQNAASPSYPPQ